MSVLKDIDSKLSDRLPSDWRKRVAAYRGGPAYHYRRVLKTLNGFDWMSQEERERAAFVIVEKEVLREMSNDADDD